MKSAYVIAFSIVLALFAGYMAGYGNGYFHGVKWSVHLAGIALDRGALNINIDEDLVTRALILYSADAEGLLYKYNSSQKLNLSESGRLQSWNLKLQTAS